MAIAFRVSTSMGSPSTVTSGDPSNRMSSMRVPPDRKIAVRYGFRVDGFS
jgi:hypothetical protein